MSLRIAVIDNPEHRELDSMLNEEDIDFSCTVADSERGGISSRRKAVLEDGRQGPGFRAAQRRREAGFTIGSAHTHAGRRALLSRLLVSGLHDAAHQFG